MIVMMVLCGSIVMNRSVDVSRDNFCSVFSVSADSYKLVSELDVSVSLIFFLVLF